VKGDISDTSFNRVPSRSKKIRSICICATQDYGLVISPMFKVNVNVNTTYFTLN
jgi:hypothetical protein